MGILPNLFFHPIAPPVERLLNQVRQGPFSNWAKSGRAGASLSPLTAIVPMACVAAAGIASMTAEAFRAPGERMPIGPLGAIGLVGAGIASALLWGRTRNEFRCRDGRQLRPLRELPALILGLFSLDRALPARDFDRARLPHGEALHALMRFATAGMPLHGHGVRPPGHLPRPLKCCRSRCTGSPVIRLIPPTLCRSRAQVLPARRLLPVHSSLRNRL